MKAFLFLIPSGAAFAVNLLLTPLLLFLSHKNKWYDNIDNRKIHTGNIPRIGGIGIFLSLLTGYTVFYFTAVALNYDHSILFFNRFWPFLAGVVLIHVVGLIDDFSGLRPLYKLIVQIAAASFIAFGVHSFTFLYIPFFNVVLNIGPFSYLLTIFWIVGVCNAVNFIDGMDGLSGGLSAIIALFMGVLFFSLGSYTSAAIAFALFGGTAGFLIFNLPPAKIFMGDSGSLLLGFILASLPLLETSRISSMVLILSITLLLIPILDTLSAIVRRLRKKKPIHNPDKEHVHHKFLTLGFSAKKILACLYSINVLLGITVLLWVITREIFAVYIILAIWIIVFCCFLLLGRLNRKKHKPL